MAKSGSKRLALWISLALVILLSARPVFAVDVKGPDNAPVQSFFNSVETRRENLDNFSKWTGVLERQRLETEASMETCKTRGSEPCAYQKWLDYLQSLRGRPFPEQLEAVNSYMNYHPYVPDVINWGLNDYWETPGEFLVRDGDCEDYAIAKLFSLRRLGYVDMDLRIVVVQDMNLNVAHAILVVRTNGKTWVLDNQIKRVVDAANVYHYRPIYSINEHYWWLHRVN